MANGEILRYDFFIEDGKVYFSDLLKLKTKTDYVSRCFALDHILFAVSKYEIDVIDTRTDTCIDVITESKLEVICSIQIWKNDIKQTWHLSICGRAKKNESFHSYSITKYFTNSQFKGKFLLQKLNMQRFYEKIQAKK